MNHLSIDYCSWSVLNLTLSYFLTFYITLMFEMTFKISHKVLHRPNIMMLSCYIWRVPSSQSFKETGTNGTELYAHQNNQYRARFMVFHATFNSISWRSFVLVEETGVPGENHRPVASHWPTLSHEGVSSTLHHWQRIIYNFSGDRR